jgi:hypothetical protein
VQTDLPLDTELSDAEISLKLLSYLQIPVEWPPMCPGFVLQRHGGVHPCHLPSLADAVSTPPVLTWGASHSISGLWIMAAGLCVHFHPIPFPVAPGQTPPEAACDYICFHTDMADITNSYLSEHGSCFWVAECGGTGGGHYGCSESRRSPFKKEAVVDVSHIYGFGN